MKPIVTVLCYVVSACPDTHSTHFSTGFIYINSFMGLPKMFFQFSNFFAGIFIYVVL